MRFHQGNKPVVAVRTRLSNYNAVPAAVRNRINLSCHNSRFTLSDCTFGRRQVRHREPTASAHPVLGPFRCWHSTSPLTQIKTAPARERAYPCLPAARLQPRNTQRAPAELFWLGGVVYRSGTSPFLMEVSRCRSVVGLQFRKIHSDTKIVQFRLSPPTPAEIAAKVSQKMGQKTHLVLSSVADPGPAGFHWEELKSTDDTD